MQGIIHKCAFDHLHQSHLLVIIIGKIPLFIIWMFWNKAYLHWEILIYLHGKKVCWTLRLRVSKMKRNLTNKWIKEFMGQCWWVIPKSRYETQIFDISKWFLTPSSKTLNPLFGKIPWETLCFKPCCIPIKSTANNFQWSRKLSMDLILHFSLCIDNGCLHSVAMWCDANTVSTCNEAWE